MAQPHDTFDYGLNEVRELHGTVVHRGVITSISESVDECDLVSDEFGAMTGVEIFFHCEGASDTTDGRQAFAVDDEVIVVSKNALGGLGGNQEHRVVGLWSGDLPRCLGNRFLQILFQMSSTHYTKTKFIIYDIQAGAVATQIPASATPGDFVTFPCGVADLNYAYTHGLSYVNSNQTWIAAGPENDTPCNINFNDPDDGPFDSAVDQWIEVNNFGGFLCGHWPTGGFSWDINQLQDCWAAAAVTAETGFQSKRISTVAGTIDKDCIGTNCPGAWVDISDGVQHWDINAFFYYTLTNGVWGTTYWGVTSDQQTDAEWSQYSPYYGLCLNYDIFAPFPVWTTDHAVGFIGPTGMGSKTMPYSGSGSATAEFIRDHTGAQKTSVYINSLNAITQKRDVAPVSIDTDQFEGVDSIVKSFLGVGFWWHEVYSGAGNSTNFVSHMRPRFGFGSGVVTPYFGVYFANRSEDTTVDYDPRDLNRNTTFESFLEGVLDDMYTNDLHGEKPTNFIMDINYYQQT